MPLIQWSDSLSVGIGEIDGQHKTLVSFINDLHFAMSQGKGSKMTQLLLGKLVGYTRVHFGEEEKYMQRWSYPDFAAHKVEHEAFVKKVTDFQAQSEAGKIGLSIDLFDFLKGWLVNHIEGTDKKYAPFFVSHGLK